MQLADVIIILIETGCHRAPITDTINLCAVARIRRTLLRFSKQASEAAQRRTLTSSRVNECEARSATALLQ